MEKIIRYLVDKRGDLYVLYEKGKKDWSVIVYPASVGELRERTKDYFSTKMNLPISELSDSLMDEVLREGIKAKEADSSERERFIDSFIEDVFLKAYPELPLLEYLKQNCNSNIYPATEGLQEKLNDFVSILYEHPEIIDLQNEGTFYREVRFCNKLSRRFEGYREFKAYCEKDIELDISLSKALTQADLVYITKDKAYAVEIKSRRRVRKGLWKAKGKKQSRLAAHFLRKNFNADCVAVNVEHFGSKSKKMRYRHRIFNQETNKFELVKKFVWMEVGF